jgi:hypothetical protein
MPLGAVGPLTWPTAYEDVIGYTLWPERYSQRLLSHGIGDVLGAIFMSTGPWAANARLRGPRSADARTDAADGPSGCPGKASTDWPASEIERSISLTADQRAALEQLRSAIGDAVEAIKAGCRDAAERTPVERIRAMQNSLWAVRDAAILIRAPLDRFYDTLDDEQKKQFVIADAAPDPRSAAAATRGAARNEIARMCGVPSRPSDNPIRRIERELRLTPIQRASFDELQKKTSEMGQFLLASCLQPIPSTPTARLDAATDRLTAVVFAANHVGLALNDAYNRLSEQQQAKLKAFSH